MTLKLEEKITWVVFGYGMIGRVHADIPETEIDPIIVFTHKMAVGGKFHNGAPILTPKEEKKMLKECDMLVADLNANFVHSGDFVKLSDDYNQPKNPRANAKEAEPEPVVETPKVVAKTRKARVPKEAPKPVVVETPVTAKRTTLRIPRKTAAPVMTEEEKLKQVRLENLAKGRAKMMANRAAKKEAARKAEAEAAAKTTRRRMAKTTPAPDVVKDTPKRGRRRVTETA